MHYSTYRDAYLERLAICSEQPDITERQAHQTAEKEIEEMLREFESKYFIRDRVLHRIKKELQ